MSVLHDQGLAEDAVHEAVFRISKSLNRFEDLSGDERRYLCVAIAKNMALNIVRKRKGGDTPLDGDVHAEYTDIPLKLDIIDAINALDEGLYQVVMFRLRYEFNTAETARMMGITQGAVRRRLNRARQILRKSLRNEKTISIRS
jgi:RNA polymerase sigma-70 factor (ECF subfamily)